MSGAYRIGRISEAEAEEVWGGSPQASVFSRPSVLSKLHEVVEWWAVFKGCEAQCSWPVPIDGLGQVVRVPFTYWVGPLWSSIASRHPAHRTLALTTSVYELFISTFLEQYGVIQAELHPTLTDVRVFDWWNYHEPSLPRFRIRPRYSAEVELLGPGEPPEAHFRELRRREIRKFATRKDDFEPSGEVGWEEVSRLYLETLADESMDMSSLQAKIRSLIGLIEEGHGWVQAQRFRSDGSLACVILLLCDTGQANMVLNVADRRVRSSGVMADAVLSSMVEAWDRGLTRFDFNGANSPRRGDDKHSYGSRPVLFFELSFPSS